MTRRSLGVTFSTTSIDVSPSPGVIDTRMTQAISGERLDRLVSRVGFGRLGTPDEVAAVIAFLCSDDAVYVSGSFYTVDGGMTNY